MAKLLAAIKRFFLGERGKCLMCGEPVIDDQTFCQECGVGEQMGAFPPD